MSCLTNGVCAAALAVSVFSPAAAASPGCPPTLDGHPMSRMDGASVYLGDPTKNALQAPGESHTTSTGWLNVWRFPNGIGPQFEILCRYEGLGRVILFALPRDTTVCRQTPRSFVCDGGQ